MRNMKATRWVLVCAILIFGLVAVGNWTSPKWIVLTLFLYSLPLLLQRSSNANIRAYALWFGIFLILQTLITPVVIDRTSRRYRQSLDTPWIFSL